MIIGRVSWFRSLCYTYPGRYGHCHYAGIWPESLLLWWPGTRTRTVEWQKSALIHLGFKVNQDPGRDTGGGTIRSWQELLLWLGQPDHVPRERLWTDKGWLCDHRASVCPVRVHVLPVIPINIPRELTFALPSKGDVEEEVRQLV